MVFSIDAFHEVGTVQVAGSFAGYDVVLHVLQKILPSLSSS